VRGGTSVVLLVDDSESDLRSIGDLLRKKGYAVRTAENGLSALRAALRSRPDLIVSDLEMPAMDGWTLLRMVRARKEIADVPLVFLTRLSGDEERLLGYRLGVDDYITKDTTGDEIAARVRRLLRRAREEAGRGPAGRALRGDVDQVSLASLLSFLDLEHKTGVLEIVQEGAGGAIGRKATVHIRHGQPVRAEVGHSELSLRERMFHLLGWTRGAFMFQTAEVRPEAGDQPSRVAELLLEFARRSDEAAGR